MTAKGKTTALYAKVNYIPAARFNQNGLGTLFACLFGGLVKASIFSKQCSEAKVVTDFAPIEEKHVAEKSLGFSQEKVSRYNRFSGQSHYDDLA